MNLKYFKANDFNNFGDELSPYIFNHLFDDIFSSEKYNDIDFYGIGSIIDARICPDKKVVIFGTGIRDITMHYNTINWNVRFLRGPVSSNILGFKGEKYIADGAYCMLYDETLIPKNLSKKYRYSLMPHYRQMDKVNWNLIAKLADIHIIDPRDDFRFVLDEIARTENLLSIAMHGAIVADIMRIPWQRIKMEAISSEKPLLSDLKWLDFLTALELNDYYSHIRNYDTPIKYTQPMSWTLYYEIISKIKRAKKNAKFQLSSDNKLMEIKSRIINEVELFKNQYI